MRKLSKKLLATATPIIETIAKRYAGSSAFAYFTSDDIYQEVWGMCLSALKRYDPEKGTIEHYLRVHVSHRMRNLKRDKYFRPNPDANGVMHPRMNLVNAMPLEGGDIPDGSQIIASSAHTVDPADIAYGSELLELLRSELNEDNLSTLECVLNGRKTTDEQLQAMRQEVAEILEQIDGKD